MNATSELLVEWLRRRRYAFADARAISDAAAEALADGNDDDVVLALASTSDPAADVDGLIERGLRDADVTDADTLARTAMAGLICQEIAAGAVEPMAGARALTTLFFEDETDTRLTVFWRLNAESDDLDNRAAIEAEIVEAARTYLADERD